MKNALIALLTLVVISCKNNKTTIANAAKMDSTCICIPQSNGLINDFAFVFNKMEEHSLDSIVKAVHKNNDVQIAIVTFDTILCKDKSFDKYVLDMHNCWGVGDEVTNNGILIALSPQLRKARISNGYGIEALITDEETKKVLYDYFIASFKDGKYFEGMKTGIVELVKLIGSKKNT